MSGVAVEAGFNAELSHRFNDRVELLGRLKLTTADECPRVATFGARFYLWKRLALTADVRNDDFGIRYGIGLRLEFSRH